MAVDVLVTGGNGVLGHRIVQILRSNQKKVVATGRTPSSAVDAVWDISQQESPTIDYQPRAVVHAAALIGSYRQSISEATDLFETNVRGTLRVAQWCVSKQVRQLILISSAIVYGEWTGTSKDEKDLPSPWVAGPYAVSKWCAEQAASLVKNTGIKLTILRLSSLYGEGYESSLVQRLLQQGQAKNTIELRQPFDDSFDLLNVADAARTVCLAFERGLEGTWNVGSGSLTTIQTLVEACSRQINAEVFYSNEAPERPPRVINWVNDQKARVELGHSNQVSLNAGIMAIASEIDKTSAEWTS